MNKIKKIILLTSSILTVAFGVTGLSSCELLNGLTLSSESSVCSHEYQTTTVEATCTKRGYDLLTCALCGDTKEDNYTEIDPTAHKYEEKVTAPTCMEQGYTTYTCDCGDSYEGDYVSATGHQYAGGVCSICHEVKASEGLRFVLNDDEKTYSVKGMGECKDLDIVIPSTYEGLPVVAIEDGAFFGVAITSVTIPEGITSIGGTAFYGCYKLVSVTIPETVQSIGSNAFYNCYKLIEVYNKSALSIEAGQSENGHVGYYAKNVYKPNVGQSKLSTENGYILYTDGTDKLLLGYTGEETNLSLPDGITEIYKYAFYNHTSIMSVEIPEGVTSIGDHAFVLCAYVTEITVPDSVTAICGYAFSECYNLTRVTVGKSVSTIHNDAFSNCFSLVEVCNKSNLDIRILKGMTQYGFTDRVKYVYRPTEGESRLSTDENGYIIYTHGADKILVAHKGFEGDLTLPQDITEINNHAFYKCGDLTSVVIPDSVKVIRENAFMDCWNLESVKLGDRVESIEWAAFHNCSKLIDLTFGSGLKTIGERVFASCTALESIQLPDGLEKIDANAFEYCHSLSSVSIPDSLTSMGYQAFDGCGSLEYNRYDQGRYLGNENNPYFILMKSAYNCETIEFHPETRIIATNVFSNNTSLKNITLTEKISILDDGAFYECSSLTSVEIPSSVKSVGDSAFMYCTNLTRLVVGEKVEEIGEIAFYGCYKLIEVCNKSSLNIEIGSEDYGSVGFYAKRIYKDISDSKLSTDENGYILYTEGSEKTLVAYAGKDADLTLPSGITAIGGYAFYESATLESVIFPDGLTSIGEYAFAYCKKLTEIKIPDSGKVIQINAFRECTSLKSVNLGNGVETIEKGAFYNCTNLTSVEIGDGLKTIGGGAFVNCGKLATVVIGANTETIEKDAFSNCNKIARVYYKGTVETWGGITVGSNNSKMTSARRYYYIEKEEDLPEGGGNYWHYNENGVPVVW